MIRRLMKYNPAFLSRRGLVKSFVVRLTDLELILETIRHNTGDTNQHILIIGPRGSGKTSLVLRTVEQVKQDSELAPKRYPSSSAKTATKFVLRVSSGWKRFFI